MGDPRGFVTTPRATASRRPVDLRLSDWREVYEPFPDADVRSQAGRCMDCGIPFCHQGCPLGNLIPEWNDLVFRSDWSEAAERLHGTNNFPELTGRLCPAPCETACVVGIGGEPVSIKQVEVAIADRSWDEGWLVPRPPATASGWSVAVVGSGPAGLAAAQQLTRAGHRVVVFERADRIGGLLRYGIPEFKLEKRVLDRRLAQMAAEGTTFRTGVTVGADPALLDAFDAVVLAIGATVPRDLPIPGRDLGGIHQAMEYLPWANRVQAGDLATTPIDAADRHVVILGGGDTGADCLGTAHRQRAASVTQLEILARPPANRPEQQPWPMYPAVFRTSSAHEEGGDRQFSLSTTAFVGGKSGRVGGVRVVEVVAAERGGFEEVPASAREIPADLVLLALGFTGPEPDGVVGAFGLRLDPRGAVARDERFATDVDGFFVAGDAGRGQSLIVWAIAEGRACAAAVDEWLTGGSNLPAPVAPSARPLAV
jgi:glutamate synthase (NADPH) small chain